MTQPAVRYEAQGPIGVITLDRPDNRNSMTPELLSAFADAADAAIADANARVVIITGTGRCFSAGADFRSQIQASAGDEERTPQPHERSYAMYRPFLRVLDIEVPVIGALNGHAIGGGFGLSLVCDLRVAERDSLYGANFAKLGLHSGMAISYLLPRLIGPARAAELLFTGRRITGAEAMELGLVNRVASGAAVWDEALAMARDIAASAPVAVRMMKRSLYTGLGWDVRRGALDEAFAQAVTVDTEDAREGMAALLAKRSPEFRGR
ncbi:MAG: enoyl-CoA hydratase/isomerase family protein [Deltaproteobacteria bacterium]|nr:enoyl-CoA hydratase/isomerase family protein [Deltaproteobacteria bacterium]